MNIVKRAATLDDRLGLASAVTAGALVLSLWWFKLSSIDTGYHLAYGEEFLKTGQIVTLDPFLDPSIAKPFINANWGSQVIMATVERAAGATGLIALRWLLLAVIFLSIALIVRQASREWFWPAWAWMLVAAIMKILVAAGCSGYATAVMLVVLIRGLNSGRGTAQRFADHLDQSEWVFPCRRDAYRRHAGGRAGQRKGISSKSSPTSEASVKSQDPSLGGFGADSGLPRQPLACSRGNFSSSDPSISA
jgi:hypothetical protein